MADHSKKFSGRPGATANAKSPPQTTPGAKRAFDARPKPSDAERRDPNTRPTRHIDEARPELVDPIETEE